MKFKKNSVFEFYWLFMQRNWSEMRITQLVGLRIAAEWRAGVGGYISSFPLYQNPIHFMIAAGSQSVRLGTREIRIRNRAMIKR